MILNTIEEWNNLKNLKADKTPNPVIKWLQDVISFQDSGVSEWLENKELVGTV